MLIDFTFLVFYFFFSCWFSRIEKFKLEFFYLQVMILCVRVVLKNLLRTEFAIHNGWIQDQGFIPFTVSLGGDARFESS